MRPRPRTISAKTAGNGTWPATVAPGMLSPRMHVITVMKDQNFWRRKMRNIITDIVIGLITGLVVIWAMLQAYHAIPVPSYHHKPVPHSIPLTGEIQ